MMLLQVQCATAGNVPVKFCHKPVCGLNQQCWLAQPHFLCADDFQYVGSGKRGPAEGWLSLSLLNGSSTQLWWSQQTAREAAVA